MHNCGCKRPAVGPEPHAPVPLHGGGFVPNAIEWLKRQVDKLFGTAVFTVNGRKPEGGNVEVLVPSKVSAFENDAGYLTEVGISDVKYLDSALNSKLTVGTEGSMDVLAIRPYLQLGRSTDGISQSQLKVSYDGSLKYREYGSQVETSVTVKDLAAACTTASAAQSLAQQAAQEAAQAKGAASYVAGEQAKTDELARGVADHVSEVDSYVSGLAGRVDDVERTVGGKLDKTGGMLTGDLQTSDDIWVKGAGTIKFQDVNGYYTKLSRAGLTRNNDLILPQADGTLALEYAKRSVDGTTDPFTAGFTGYIPVYDKTFAHCSISASNIFNGFMLFLSDTEFSDTSAGKPFDSMLIVDVASDFPTSGVSIGIWDRNFNGSYLTMPKDCNLKLEPNKRYLLTVTVFGTDVYDNVYCTLNELKKV